MRDEFGEVEPKQFELDEVEANCAVLQALQPHGPTEESADLSDASLCTLVKTTYANLLPNEHPARAHYQ